MKIKRPRLGVCVFVRRRRGDRFFPGTLFQDRLRPASRKNQVTYDHI